jgi:YMGG-like Gly-zipper
MKSQRKKLAIAAVLVSLSSMSSTGFAQTREGAMLGGVAGAVIGGIVGHQNDETPEGALIGGAVGAIAGGMIGNQRQQQERIRYYEQQQYQQRYYQQPQCYHNHYQVQQTPVYAAPTYVTTVRPAPVRRAVTAQDVIMLTRNRVSETVIANHIQMNGVVASPSIDDVLRMHDAGVSDFVINEMQHARLVGSTTVVTQTQIPQQPVIVREEVYTTPIDHTPSSYYNGSTPYYQRSSQLQPVPTNRQRF